jgi:hypothetical protein
MTDEVLLWILSDLHLELTRGWDLPSGDARPRFHVMVIAGDLIPRMERGVKWLRRHVPDRPVIYIAGNHEGYSASSRTVIKNAFHLAILFASCLDARMKYPRFLLLDNIEDKGMTPQRSHNFQRLILEHSKKAEAEHQIIFTTSMPAPDLDDPKYTVGSRYTETNMSLKLS